MSCYFSENEEIRFETGKAFVIKEIIGRGASSVVYRAVNTTNQTEHLLKEYHPSYISLTRGENGDLIVEDVNDHKSFKDGLDRFLGGCELQRKFRDDPDLKNVTSNIQDVHYGYGTVFIDMTYFSGKSYEKIKEKSLSDLIRRIKALTQTIGQYHNKGYLHLDLKPENIFALPETSEMIMLFDFDSVVAKNDLRNLEVRLSYTPKWAAPELLGSNPFLEANESTDLYSIGMIFFHKLTGRFPDQNQLRSGQYSFDPNCKLLKGTSKRVLSLLSTFFRSTLCETKEGRWQTSEEMIDALDELLDMVNHPQKSHKLILIAALFLCIPLVLFVFGLLSSEAGKAPNNNIDSNHQEILDSGTSTTTDKGPGIVDTIPNDSTLEGTTSNKENNSQSTDATENLTGTSTSPTEESTRPSASDNHHSTYVVDTIIHTSEYFRSLIVTNDGVVYYLDGSVISNSSGSISIDMQSDFDEPLQNGYLAYDPYNDIVYLLSGGSLSIYDVSNLSSPTLVVDNTEIHLEYTSGVTPQIAVLPDGSLLIPADSDGTYRVNPFTKQITPFSRVYSLQSPYYAKLVGDSILTLRENSKEATVIPLTGGQEKRIQLEKNAPYRNAVYSTSDSVLFYSDGVGVCQFSVNGTFSVFIAQEAIKTKDYQSLDHTNIWAIVANNDGVIAFYDNTLKCIRCISPE